MSPLLQALRTVSHPHDGHPVTSTAAASLARYAETHSSDSRPSSGLRLSVAGDAWGTPESLPSSLPPDWVWAQISKDGDGDLHASQPAFLYAFVRLLTDGVLDVSEEDLAKGVLIEPTFGFHRTLYDQVLTREVEIGSPIRTRPPGSASKSVSSRTVASCRFTISRARSTKIWPGSVSRTPRLPRSSSREP